MKLYEQHRWQGETSSSQCQHRAAYRLSYRDCARRALESVRCFHCRYGLETKHLCSSRGIGCLNVVLPTSFLSYQLCVFATVGPKKYWSLKPKPFYLPLPGAESADLNSSGSRTSSAMRIALLVRSDSQHVPKCRWRNSRWRYRCKQPELLSIHMREQVVKRQCPYRLSDNGIALRQRLAKQRCIVANRVLHTDARHFLAQKRATDKIRDSLPRGRALSATFHTLRHRS